MDTSYINLENQGEGPFFIYFKLNYDMQHEGAIAVALHKYDKDMTSFSESQLYLLQDAQTQLLAVVEEGIYVLSI